MNIDMDCHFSLFGPEHLGEMLSSWLEKEIGGEP